MPGGSPGSTGTAAIWLSMNGSCRSRSGGGSGMVAVLVRSRTPV